MSRASGTFDVELTPQTPDSKKAEANLGRVSIAKQFTATSKEPARVRGWQRRPKSRESAAYVARERVTEC